jgi:hypothetical protein
MEPRNLKNPGSGFQSQTDLEKAIAHGPVRFHSRTVRSPAVPSNSSGPGLTGAKTMKAVRVVSRMVTGLLQWWQRISEYWFWDRGRDVLTKEEALQSVLIGDTLDGDELIVHPSKPERVFVLPRNRDEIYIAGDGLPEAMEWLCSSGTLTEAFDERNFEPFDTRRAAE